MKMHKFRPLWWLGRLIWRWQNTLVGVMLVVATLAAIRYWPRPPLSAHASSSIAVHGRGGELLRLTLSRDDKYRQWLPLAQMPAPLVDAVLLQEDAWFRWHPGVNPISLARGAFVTYVQGGNRQGGSTLTMQLARLMYGLNTRTPMGKLRQVGLAVWLEMRYAKDDILEAYLNYAPYGRNVEGVAAASLVYFGKPAQDLSLPEMLTLAVIPQDPTRRMREFAAIDSGAQTADTLGRGLRAARDRLYARWRLVHGGSEGTDAVFRLPLRVRAPSALPFVAPHAVEQALRESSLDPGPGGSRIDMTLDPFLQATVERAVADTLGRYEQRGVTNAAALLVDTRDMGVRALVGSADYADARIGGQVNGTLAKRSPGSTLKPFIYALGMDQGVLHPRTVLRDVPSSFGPFTPENYDGRFLGPVTATEALVRSRNIPAVWVASQLASPTLYDFLRQAGISRMASERHYGLALVLGGGEVTMQELAGLYALLANRGVLRPLRLRASEPVASGVRLLSEEASFMTMDMLRQNPRPDEATSAEPARLPIYWKTGTSWGFRDAWTAGVFGPYVLVVWMGNFDGAGNPALIGVEAAAPLFFRIADAILAQDRSLAEPAWTVPAHVKRVEVCLASGDLPNTDCPQRGTTWFIPGKSPIRVSTVHRRVTIDTRTGRAACPPFDPAHTRSEVFEYWPSDLARVFAQAGIPRRQPPAPASCDVDSAMAGDPPRITSPVRGASYSLRTRHVDDDRIAFHATVDAGVREVYWFLDDAFLGSARAGETFFWQPGSPGSHVARVVDDRGRADSRELRIEATQ
ncbi:penicillin-binding protein 1C [Tahibacter amnicola]|uniref:peptidoglycan glycosyltransferase n=1 Tax=Tahibacter amnicola TaxID=2976241 RepID=A0ABY6BEV5_9GAMM|nr:penicillin-binding protein 1C [Tahibacter amnicola]UXI67640.1 penicillin-binding protein 1C [Tahibacter amnicola]